MAAEAPLETSQIHLQHKVNAFTSSKEELNKPDISKEKSGAFKPRFSATLDSKGRVTVPARIRNKLGLEKGDKISLTIDPSKVISKEFRSEEKALEFLSSLDGVESFSFDGEVLEAVLDE